jgi:hypothetical protein
LKKSRSVEKKQQSTRNKILVSTVFVGAFIFVRRYSWPSSRDTKNNNIVETTVAIITSTSTTIIYWTLGATFGVLRRGHYVLNGNLNSGFHLRMNGDKSIPITKQEWYLNKRSPIDYPEWIPASIAW